MESILGGFAQAGEFRMFHVADEGGVEGVGRFGGASAWGSSRLLRVSVGVKSERVGVGSGSRGSLQMMRLSSSLLAYKYKFKLTIW